MDRLRQMHFQDDVVLNQWGIVRHGNLVQSYHCKSQEWNRHLWKHWEEWREDHPWLEVQQTGLGCSVCKASSVKRNAWSKFKACRGVSQTISPDLFVDQSPSSVWRKFIIKSNSQLLQYCIPSGFKHHHVHLIQGYGTQAVAGSTWAKLLALLGPSPIDGQQRGSHREREKGGVINYYYTWWYHLAGGNWLSEFCKEVWWQWQLTMMNEDGVDLS